MYVPVGWSGWNRGKRSSRSSNMPGRREMILYEKKCQRLLDSNPVLYYFL